MKIRNAKTVGDKIRLEAGSTVPVLGPNAEFSDCEFDVVTTAQNLLFVPPISFIRCNFRLRKPLVDFMGWTMADLENCSITGRLIGNRFGTQPDEEEREGRISCVRGCDLSKAIVHLTDFYQLDMTQVKLPGWPHFTILDPERHMPELLSQQWPSNLFLLPPNPGLVAMCYNAELLAKQVGGTPDDYKKIVTRLDYVLS